MKTETKRKMMENRNPESFKAIMTKVTLDHLESVKVEIDKMETALNHLRDTKWELVSILKKGV